MEEGFSVLEAFMRYTTKSLLYATTLPQGTGKHSAIMTRIPSEPGSPLAPTP